MTVSPTASKTKATASLAKRRANKSTATNTVSAKATAKGTKKTARKVTQKVTSKRAKKITRKTSSKVSAKSTKKATRKIAGKAKVAKGSAEANVKTKAKVKATVAKKRASRVRNSKAAKAQGDSLLGIKPYKASKREKYMNPKQREHFRAILSAWQRQLYDEVSRTMDHMQDKPENLPDPSDRASQETDITLELRNRDRERKLLGKIASSMELLDSDEYGYCSKCGVEIGIHRLEVRPTATLCVDCKSLDEIRERHMA